MNKLSLKIRKWIVVLFFIFAFIHSQTNAYAEQGSEEHQQQLDSIHQYVDKALQELKIPGASLAIVHNGDIVSTKHWGVTGGDKQQVTLTTPFLIGSNSKAITAYGIMILVQDGKLELDAPVQQYLPQFTLKDNSAAAQITIRQLIAHTSGMSAASGYKIADLGSSEPDAVGTLVSKLSDEELIYEPGQGYEYSAANYAVLGAVIEAVSNKTFADFVQSEIFEPIGMKHAAANIQNAEAKGWKPGYRSWFDISIASHIPYDNGGAPYGYIAASAEDMAKFLIAIQKPGAVLSNEYTKQLLMPLVETSSSSSYGFGWRLSTLDNGYSKIWHGGSTADFRSEVFMIPENGWGVVLLTNRNHVVEAARLTEVSNGITNILIGKEPEPINKETPAERIIFYSINGVLLALMIGMLLYIKFRKQQKVPFVWMWRSVCVVSCLIAILFLPSLLHLFQINLRTLWLFAPDIVLLASATIVLSGINGAISLSISLSGRTSSQMRYNKLN